MFVFIALLWVIAVLLVLAVLLPLTKASHGAIQGLAFPKGQFLAIALVCALVFPLVQAGALGIAGGVVMLAVAVVHAVYIAKFTRFWPKQSLTPDPELSAQKAQHISLLAANVKMSNRDYGALIDLVVEQDPDVLMAIEVDQAWIDALQSGLSTRYAHKIAVPKDNGYGMHVLSRLALSDIEVRELVTRDVPSIRVRVTLPSGEDLRLYVVHPEPPVINHDTIGRDSEIALIGLEAAADPLPAIVTGDLNDVAWSSTTRRFQRLSLLLDPRVGRGFYNTFSATHPWMRWPLDHLFHDKRFRLIDMARLRKIGSDHFPMWFKVALAEQKASNSEPAPATNDEIAETKEMIRAEQQRPRSPIGEDWEDG